MLFFWFLYALLIAGLVWQIFSSSPPPEEAVKNTSKPEHLLSPLGEGAFPISSNLSFLVYKLLGLGQKRLVQK